MNMLHAVVLGALQGFCEVLPISSSAHLILVPWFLKWPESGLTFDVALHLGTLIALAVYFRRDIVQLVVAALDAVATRSLDTPAKRLPFLILAATVPAAVVGKLFEQTMEEVFRESPLLIAAFLIVFGVILGLADRWGRKRYGLSDVKTGNALTIGLFQCLALIPGVSRSGITITAGLMLGFTRESAARFSFLLSLPIVAGAALLKTLHVARHGIPAGEGLPMLVGIAVSAITGYISVAFLLRMVQKRSIAPFVWYRLLVGAAVIALVMAG
ncbi:undecaprenyl-diphosphatase UppP [Geobacter sp. FeAm09]|uniref:undecaprenyl-diphosphatase UppP n=1 Tax=Geobacter sp. FeAm09 TaxID=2597769 RepID=UPI0011EC76D5|nr:undecaprenyl-diphosphatase UppP [Geobacter sp. FeAm09]QEM66908.1 undecaprenyl-diphosphatase UppP [Geobacter sp. FeAm09]